MGGAVFTTLIAVIILLNSYYPTEWLGHDNSYNGMPLSLYRITWMMLSASGGLYVIGECSRPSVGSFVLARIVFSTVVNTTV